MNSWKDVRTEVEMILTYCKDKGGAGGSAMIGFNEPGVFLNWEVLVHGEHFFAEPAPENSSAVTVA